MVDLEGYDTKVILCCNQCHLVCTGGVWVAPTMKKMEELKNQPNIIWQEITCQACQRNQCVHSGGP